MSILSQDDSIDLEDFKVPENNFQGFKDAFNFSACISVVTTFGFGFVLLSIFPGFVSSFVAAIGTFVFFVWYNLHGKKMTRNEVVFFDVRNLLEVAPNFEYEKGGLADECLTPGAGKQIEIPGPQSLWEALFANEGKVKMQKFYKDHYGPVYKTAERKYNEYLMQQKEDSVNEEKKK